MRELPHYTKIKWDEKAASGDYPGLILIAFRTQTKGLTLLYGETVKDCMSTYLCYVTGVKPRFPVV